MDIVKVKVINITNMANHLLQTQSLYLRKHAYNPINWWYWSKSALSQAKTENKPIFLSIGYSSCHWCTVMEGEAFSDQAIADYLNEHFIAIKVDREERPDLDSIYMQALQMMTGQGGWPLNIFLDSQDLVPFYGGTYFPIEPRYGRPAFLQILQSLNDFYHHKKDKLAAFKGEMLAGLELSSQLVTSEADNLTPELLAKGIDTASKILARNDYGSPKFPMMPYANATLHGLSITNQEKNGSIHQTAIKRGVDLVNGGIYDHVGGGFHRYTVDATWTVPHFEKMLYDNGCIMEFLANLWSSGVEKPEFKTACQGTLNWLKREMTAPEGYFYAAQDADNFTSNQDDEPEEGDFYVWPYLDLKEILSSEELTTFEEVFTITEEGNFEGKNVLQKREEEPLNPLVECCLNKLFTIRYGENPENLTKFPPAKNNEEAKNKEWLGRIPPVTDTKMIVAWNSLMISGLARAYGVFGNQEYLDFAEKAAQFILDNQWQNERLYRLNYDGKVSVLAQAEDYAFLIKALLDLHQNNLNSDDNWLTQAIKIQDEFEQYCGDENQGGYYNNSSDNSDDLLIREKSYIDNATPSANGIAISNLIRLGLLTDNLDYLVKAKQGLNLFSEIMNKSSASCPSLFTALNWHLQGKKVKTNIQLIKELNLDYLPTTIYQISTDLPNDSVGMVCRGFACLAPASTKAEILSQLTMDNEQWTINLYLKA